MGLARQSLQTWVPRHSRGTSERHSRGTSDSKQSTVNCQLSTVNYQLFPSACIPKPIAAARNLANTGALFLNFVKVRA